MRYFNWCTTAALVSFYLLALNVKGAAAGIFALLVLISLGTILCRCSADGNSFLTVARHYWPLNLAMAAPLIAVLANLLSNGHFVGRSVDQAFRLSLFVLIFWVVQLVPLRQLRHVQWAFIAGALLATVRMYTLTEGGTFRYGTDFIPMTIFAEMTLLVGFWAGFSVAWKSWGGKPAVLLKLLAVCGGLYTIYLAGSRGTWVTVPALGAIAYLAAKDLKRKYKILIVTILVVTLGIVSQFGSMVQERVSLARMDVQKYLHGTDIDTSLGLRFQLWHGSWILFKENPVFGVGIEGFQGALEDFAARNIISPAAAALPHSHNEILFALARLGLLGLVALLALYFVPAYYFGRDLRNPDKEIRSAAAMGLSLCTGIFLLGLSDVVFLWWEIFPFYVVSIALFMSFILKRRQALPD